MRAVGQSTQTATMRPSVTREEFERLECNRCGRCCNPVQMMSPLALAALLGRIEAARRAGVYDEDQERFVSWVSDLEPLRRVNNLDALVWDVNCYEYRCLRFDPRSNLCTQYEDRPWICRAFPYGRPVDDYEECVWHVDIVDSRAGGSGGGAA